MTPAEASALLQSDDPFAMGYAPESPNGKDYSFDPSLPRSLPSYAASSFQKTPIYNQQGGTCVGNAIANCMTYLEWAEKNDVVSFDGEALNMRVVGKDYGQGAAASPHDVLEDVRLHGAQAPDGLYFPKAYAWVEPNNPDAIKAAMSTPGVVVGAAIWLQDNFGVDGGKTYAPYVEGNAWGYHMVTYVGYDERGVLIQNSWDTWWGDGGFARLSWDYLRNRTGECWAVTDNPDTAKDGFVKTFDYGNNATERAVKRADLPDRKRPAVYLAKNNGRIWITDPWQAKRFGVNLYAVEVLKDTDPVWSLPVIGPDAPRSQR